MTVDGLKLPQGVFLAEKRDAAQLGEITADAFQEDPFNLWLFGKFGAMEMTFRTLAKHVYTPRGVCYRLGNMAAAMWMMPGGKLDIPMHALPAFGAKLLLQGSAGIMARAEAATEAMDRHHPATPHAYLFTIGVRQAERGQGLGRVLMQPMLDKLDAEKTPAYLENSNPANARFYESFGFKHREFIHAVPDAPPLQAMWREPRG